MSPDKVPESEEDRLELEAWMNDEEAVREADEEREILLRPGNTELLRGVRPELLDALRRGPGFAVSTAPVSNVVTAFRPQRARRWLAPAAVLAAAASIAALMLIRDPPIFQGDGPRGGAPTGALDRHFRGTVETSRGTENAPPSRVYAAAATMRIEVAQGPAEPIPAASLRVFEVDGGGRLRALPMRIRRDEDGRSTTFLAEEKVSALFGDATGARTLAIVVGGLSSDLRELAGLDLASVQARRELRCFVEQIELSGSDAAPK